MRPSSFETYLIPDSRHGRAGWSKAEAVPAIHCNYSNQDASCGITSEHGGNGWPVRPPLRFGPTGHDGPVGWEMRSDSAPDERVGEITQAAPHPCEPTHRRGVFVETKGGFRHIVFFQNRHGDDAMAERQPVADIGC